MGDRWNKLESRLREIVAQSGVPGAAIAVVVDGGRHVATFGVRRANSSEPITPQTLFDIGSCSKSFVSTAIALLVDAGKLDLDAPVQRWLPEMQLDDAQGTAELSVRDLLSNRIGFKRQIPIESFANPSLRVEEVLSRVRHLDRVHPFRRGYVYFNPGFMAARLLVERISGFEYGAFLDQHLFAPRRMRYSCSGLRRVESFVNRANGHSISSEAGAHGAPYKTPLADNAFDNWQGAAGVHTCAEDAATWLDFALTNRAVARMQQPQIEIPRAERKLIHGPPEVERVDYCLGWWTTTLHGHRLVQHAGEMFGWRAHHALLPDDGIGVCVMLNAPVPRHHAIAYTVLETLLTGESRDWCAVADRMAADLNNATTQLIETAFPIGDATTLPMQRYAGRYRHPALGDVEIVARDDALEMHFLDGRLWDQRLRPLGGHVFETRPAVTAVRDYFPVPLRARFEMRDGDAISLTDTQARYVRP